MIVPVLKACSNRVTDVQGDEIDNLAVSPSAYKDSHIRRVSCAAPHKLVFFSAVERNTPRPLAFKPSAPALVITTGWLRARSVLCRARRPTRQALQL